MNVLSIDFDIIMAPDINLYNPMIHTADNDEERVTFDKLVKDFPMLSGCRADLNHYHKIVNFLLNQISYLDAKDIRIAFSHGDIENLLENAQDVCVYNIDHHHDLGYWGPNEEPRPTCACENWADYYLKKGVISNYIWIKNNNSDERPEYKNDLRFKSFDLRDFDLDTLPKIDKLFICLSPEWTPSMYYPLFYVILDLINQQKGCHLEVY